MKHLILMSIACLTLACTAALTGCEEETQAKAQVIEYHVEGMHCDGCASNVQYDLSQIAGVSSCEVSFDDSKAIVHVDNQEAADAVVEKVKALGYTIALASATDADLAEDAPSPYGDPDADAELNGDEEAEIEGPVAG